MKRQVESIVDEVLAREPAQRPEIGWLQEKVERFVKSEQLSGRLEADRLIFERMYARVPKKSEALKLRYWRTGRHLPTRREETEQYTQALNLSAEESLYFLQACLEKNDRAFDRKDLNDPQYLLRREQMEEMIAEYVDQVPPAQMLQLDIPYSKLSGYVRHLYCMDAMGIINPVPRSSGPQNLPDHGSSSHYESEFLRQRKLFGEIPRQSMLRHIVIFSLPYLNRRIISERLMAFGYLPLTEGHTTTRGALLDDLLLAVLDLYQTSCAGKDPLTCRRWLLEQFRHIDRYLTSLGQDRYQFMYFRMMASLA